MSKTAISQQPSALSFLKRYSGVLSVFVILITIKICFIFYGPFDFKASTISDFAINPDTFYIFNIGFIAAIILNAIFLINLKTKSTLAKVLLWLGLLGLLGLIIFPTTYNVLIWDAPRIIHWIFTTIFFVSYALGMLMFSSALKKGVIRKIALILALCNILIPNLLFAIGYKSVAELASVFITSIWIVYVSFRV